MRPQKTTVNVMVKTICRVVAEKIVSRFEIFISRSPFFARDLEQNLSQSFPMPGMRGYQASRMVKTICRVVAKKIVSRFEIFISRSPFFARDLEQNLSQSFPTPGMRGYQASRLQDGRHSTRKENMINKCSKLVFFSITLLIRVTPILKVVRILFQRFI